MRYAIARRAVERDLARLSERFARIHFLRRGPRRKSRTRSGAACMETTQYPEGGAPVRRTARAGARRLGDGPPAPLPRRELRLTAARTVLTQFGACRCWRMAEAMPDATLAVAPHAGHTVHLESPEYFAERVLTFVSRTAGIAVVAI